MTLSQWTISPNFPPARVSTKFSTLTLLVGDRKGMQLVKTPV